MAGKTDRGPLTALPRIGDEVEWGMEPDAALLRGRLVPWELALLVGVGVVGAAATVLAVVGFVLLR